MRRAAAIVLLACAAAAADEEPPVDPDAPSLRVLATKDGQPALAPRVKVGEPFHIVVTVSPRADVVAAMPASFPTGTFEVVERREVPGVSAERSFDLTVVAWEPGRQTFPPIPVTYVPKGQGQIKQIRTRGLDVEVTAVLGEDRGADLMPLAPPVPVLRRDWVLVYAAAGAAGALVLAAGGLLLARRARRRRRTAVARAPVVDVRPPHEIALDKLRALAASPLLDAADRRPLYFALSEVVREYLGRRYAIAALDMTTSELLAAVAEPLRDELGGWLGECDLVKFARGPASRDDAAAAVAAAIGLVERSAPEMAVAG